MKTTYAMQRQPSISDELKAQAKRADILSLLGPLPRRRESRANGGEWHIPCPKCGGKDRLIIWPYHPNGPRLACRQCHDFDTKRKTLDAIETVKWLGLAADFPRAVALLTGGTIPPRPPAPPATIDTPRPYRPPPAGQRVTARYSYFTYAPGQADHPILHWQKERRQPGPRGKSKTFYTRRPRPDLDHPPRDDCPEDWYAGRGDIPDDDLLPYNWPTALTAPAGVPILWVDGERDVESARAVGLIALCGPDGGDSWQEWWGVFFEAHPALVVPDSTPEGPAQAERAARLIAAYARSVKIVKIPIGKDFSEWAAARRAEGATHVA